MSEPRRRTVSNKAPAAPKATDVRKEVGHRLRATRSSLGYTQEQMAYALGIQPARYNKYEIGRSEAPYEILIRIAHLANVDLDYVIAGQQGRLGRRREPQIEQLNELLQPLPIPAVLFDKARRLLAYNPLYKDAFFAEHPPRLLRRGTPQDVLIRAWAHAHGFSPSEVEAYVKARLNPKLYTQSPVELRVGPMRFQIAEAIDAEKRLVVITDLNQATTKRVF